ncbi:arginase family protein [Streptomyces sp. NBC_01500]|uniref:arginase family protein n=1 Tax=Streptomyces sp. NBC_01500 TaxID=2903886 RepID=UPI0022563C44|nr:arginase family protein [Streptomyces sp. NBC_01500]MCX4547646.1 arginase family protein [Streptomyces sp. NBC_01500]
MGEASDDPHGTGLVGFGGAAVTPLGGLASAPSAAACFFGVDLDISRRFGDNSDGAATFVRRWSARMRPWARRYRPSAIDVGILSGDAGDMVRGISEIYSTVFAAGYVPVVIGGDHTVSYPVAVTAAARHQDLTYVYLDAHLDLGLHLDGSGEVHNGNFVAALAAGGAFREVVNVGARAWTTYDDPYGPGGPVTVIRDVDPGALSALRGRKVHVSLDVDVLDPVYVPNTGSKEPFGASPEQVRRVMAWIADNCTVVSADVSELVPDPAHRETAEIAMRCIHELVKERKTR